MAYNVGGSARALWSYKRSVPFVSLTLCLVRVVSPPIGNKMSDRDRQQSVLAGVIPSPREPCFEPFVDHSSPEPINW
ncbi:hypothetical protein DUNSADRAFT_6423 [Dunaliella salina]|uniref:Encoded protein n=1 Tax=Dunaliella salina TaxID=3046 RepID=A0ABQ7H6T6_DUNSA|nr:hypothetical protein DUNSADRAFT_6423 [Dunaliella salina]|eukprot:KAF5842573.1 hypothetical protein DUNSADRAFT_6423 [Dunaliella salina]